MSENPTKRRKIDDSQDSDGKLPRTLQREISPPPFRGRARQEADNETSKNSVQETQEQGDSREGKLPTKTAAPLDNAIRSPFQLTAIRDLDAICNVDALTLDDLLGGPDITEAWLFDYLFDVDFVMSAFAPRIRDTVAVKIVHGSWQEESSQRVHLENRAKHYPNVELLCAWMPERFGTHHSKMMVLFTAASARVIVHTANMIPFDWANLTQGVWLSPPLPLLDSTAKDSAATTATPTDRERAPAIGSGARFKVDLLRYLRKYEHRTAPLVARLRAHSFDAVRAAFLASAPGAEGPDADVPYTLFGWPGLRQILRAVPPEDNDEPQHDDLAIQVSSVATVPEAWLAHFHRVLATTGSRSSARERSTSTAASMTAARPRLRLVFPATGEIRASLDGYASGASIHLKGATAAQQKQLQRLRPLLCRWSGGSDDGSGGGGGNDACGRGNALRGLAAPHVKTYVRLATKKKGGEGAGDGATRVRWALLTSANLSTQAWGALPDTRERRVRVCSYEVGVVVWPALFTSAADENAADGKGPGAGERRAVEMCPVFGRDSLEACSEGGDGPTLVPLRLPFGLPLEGYKRADQPWCGNVRHHEPDWLGKMWTPGE